MKTTQILTSLAVFFAMLTTSMNAQGAVRVFHSPGDDGTSPPEIVTLEPGSHTLHLYIETGLTPSQNAPCDTGDGEEVCQWMIDTRGEGDVSLESFTPVGDVKWNLNGQLLTATGGDHELGNLGAFKIGDLAISATDAGSVALIHGEVAGADLSVSPLQPEDIVAVPEPGAWTGLLSGALLVAALGRVRTGTRATR
jgi:hypothetical protein